MKPGAPWSVKGIDPKAREVAKSIAHSQGKSLGDWMTEMILSAGEEAPPAAASGDGVAQVGPADVATTASSALPRAEGQRADGRPPAPAADPRLMEALTELTRRLDQIEQRVTVGTQSLSRDVSILREGLQNLGREFVATRRQTAAQQEAILKRTEQAIAVAGATSTGLTDLREKIDALPQRQLPPPTASPDGTQTAPEGEEDSEYEIVEYELKEGEDPRDYAGEDEFEVVVTEGAPGSADPARPSAAQAAPPQAAPPQTASPQAAPPQAAPPQTAPPQAAPPQAAPVAGAAPSASTDPTPVTPDAAKSAPGNIGLATAAGSPPTAQAPQPAPGRTVPPLSAPSSAAPSSAAPSSASPSLGSTSSAAPTQGTPAQGTPAQGTPAQGTPIAAASSSAPFTQAPAPQAPQARPTPEQGVPQSAAPRPPDPAQPAPQQVNPAQPQQPAVRPGVIPPPGTTPPDMPAQGSAGPGPEHAVAGATPLKAAPATGPAVGGGPGTDERPGPGGEPHDPASQNALTAQRGRRLRLPIGAGSESDRAATQAPGRFGSGLADSISGGKGTPPPPRAGGLPRLSGSHPAETDGKASAPAELRPGTPSDRLPAAEASSKEGHPLLDAVDRRSTAAGAPGASPLFGMTWRKGLGVPPRNLPATTWDDASPTETRVPDSPAGDPPEPPEAGADAPGTRTARPDTDQPEVPGKPGPMPGPATGPTAGNPPDPGRAGADSRPATDRALVSGGVLAALRTDGGRPAEDRPAEGSPAEGSPAEDSPGDSGGGPPDLPDVGLAGTAPGGEAPRWSGFAYRDGRRRRNLVIAGAGLVLAAAGIAALLFIEALTGPPTIDYVALDAELQGDAAAPAAPPGAPGSPPGSPPGPGTGGPDSGGVVRGVPAELSGGPAADPAGPARLATGTGSSDDPVAALRLASDQGSPQAAYELGLRLRDGIEVRPDSAAAVAQFRRAAELGYAPAQSALGVAYQTGQGIARDLDQAAYWYAIAADQGNPDAQFNFGTLYARGDGVDQDYFQAARWFQRAADAGLPDAQFNYANMLEQGLGVTADPAQAYRYFALAAAAGDPVAAERRRALAATLPSEEVAALDHSLAAPAAIPAPPLVETPAGDTAAADAAQALAERAAEGTDQDMAEAADPAPTPAETEAALRDASVILSQRADIAELQALLNDLGFAAGPADGVIGGRTRSAITAFQEAAGLPADGTATRGLLAELRQLAERVQ